jgi:hypothetical protein
LSRDFYVSINLQIISKKEKFIKMFNERDTRVEPCGTDNTQNGEENFPKIQTKKDLFDK